MGANAASGSERLACASPALAVDVGGYRFQESQLLPAQLVWKALELPTTCYDYGCQAECEGPQNCYVIKERRAIRR